MNNFSCSLSCTWMKIIDCLFYDSDSLHVSWDVSWEFIAELLVAWLKFCNYKKGRMFDPLCINGFLLLAWYNKHGTANCNYQESTFHIFHRKYFFFVWRSFLSYDGLPPISKNFKGDVYFCQTVLNLVQSFNQRPCPVEAFFNESNSEWLFV